MGSPPHARVRSVRDTGLTPPSFLNITSDLILRSNSILRWKILRSELRNHLGPFPLGRMSGYQQSKNICICAEQVFLELALHDRYTIYVGKS